MTEAQDWSFVRAFEAFKDWPEDSHRPKALESANVAVVFGPDLRILSIHQHLRSQQKEVVVVAGVDAKVRINFE